MLQNHSLSLFIVPLMSAGNKQAKFTVPIARIITKHNITLFKHIGIDNTTPSRTRHSKMLYYKPSPKQPNRDCLNQYTYFNSGTMQPVSKN